MKDQKPREIAADILLQREKSKEFVERLCERAFATASLNPPDRRLVQELVFGVARWEAALDWFIERKARRHTQRPSTRILLRLGLYQLFWLERIPAHAAVHETVELAKRRGQRDSVPFINAVLRSYTREREAAWREFKELQRKEPATGYSHPQWLVDRWRARWGDAQTTQLLEWNNRPAKPFARLNQLKASAHQLLEAWKAEGVESRAYDADWMPPNTVFELGQLPPLQTLPSFQQGWFYLQDPSTLLAVHLLDPRPGEQILDLCAAPGGKAACIADRLQNQGMISAQDPFPQRLALLEENVARLGITCIEITRPSQIVFPELTAKFDRILVDAPCSNTGVMRRRVDVRWRLHPDEITRLRSTQLELLHEASLQLAPSGRLVYSTCSLEPEENSGVIQEFLQSHPGFVLQMERELRPFEDACDGAYVAVLQK